MTGSIYHYFDRRCSNPRRHKPVQTAVNHATISHMVRVTLTLGITHVLL